MNKRFFITGGSGFIGTNLIELLQDSGFEIFNYDKKPPLNSDQKGYWFEGDILDFSKLEKKLVDFAPDYVIHLAARADTFGESLSDYTDNTDGTRNLVNALLTSGFSGRFVATSTQYVYKSNSIFFPASDFDYKPHTVYGVSKVITEEIVRGLGDRIPWVIVRPSNIWGPWHMRYPVELFKMISSGFYIHPRNDNVIRTYGYVKNIVHQILDICFASDDLFCNKVYYLGDPPISSTLWINALSNGFNGRDVLQVPAVFLRVGAMLGDFIKSFGFSFPLYSSRFNNMVESYPAPTQETIDHFGQFSDELDLNVRETISWIKCHEELIRDYWKNF